MPKSSIKNKFFILLPFILGALFLFSNLSNHSLWEDEAETAVLAKSVMHHGIPKAFDGQNLLYLHIKDSYRSGSTWTFHPWLQCYITALSFYTLGISTFSARFPFALIGFFTLILFYFLTLKLFNTRSIALLSTWLLVFSIYFILHMRQCRYYAPTVFFTLSFLFSYLHFIEQKKYALLYFILSANFLFHSNYGAFIPVMGAIILHYFIFHHSKKDILKKFLLALLAIFLLIFPWFIYLKGYQHRGVLDFHHISHQVQFYFRAIYKYMIPLLFFALVSLAQILYRKKSNILSFWKQFSKENTWLLLLVILVTLVFSIIGDQRYFRYILHLLPLFLILEALLFHEWFKQSLYVSRISFALILLTNILHYSAPTYLMKTLPSRIQTHLAALYPPGKLEDQLRNTFFSPPYQYLYELTHTYKDPLEGIISFLLKNVAAGETVGTPYTHRSLIFYTPFKIIHLRFEKEVLADWIIFQKEWFEDIYGSCETSAYCKKISTTYQKFVLNYPDILWNNMPEPTYHKFKTVTDAPNLIIYKKQR